MIGLMTQRNYLKNGLQTFEANTVPPLLEEESFEAFYHENGVHSLWQNFKNIRELQQKIEDADGRFDKLFVPAQNRLRFNTEKLDMEVVPYVHDILPYTSEYREKRNRFLRPFIDALKNKLDANYVTHLSELDKAVAASKVTAQDLKTRTSFTGDVEVVYQGVDDMPEPENVKSYGENRCIDILYVGELFERKNPEFTRKVFRKAQNSCLNVAWVNLHENDLPGKNFVDVTDQKLAEIYSNSKFVLHPSFMEGFGRCPVEAQRYGCIPLALDIPINREVLGEKEVAWKSVSTPEEALELAKSFESEEMRYRAKKNSERFRWSKTRERLKEVLLES